MRTVAQITISDLMDVAASETPPADPITGQIWIDISVAPPATKLWNGSEWENQTGQAQLGDAITSLEQRESRLREQVLEMAEYSGTVSERIALLADQLDSASSYSASMIGQLTALNQLCASIENRLEALITGGANLIPNSTGLNGTAGWTVSGTVTVDRSTDTVFNTVSGACFALGANSTLSVRVSGLDQQREHYLTLRYKRLSAGGQSACSVVLSDRTETVFNLSGTVEWTFAAIPISTIPSGVLDLVIASTDERLRIADIMLVEGSIPRTWAPASGEIYHPAVAVDSEGVTVTDAETERQTSIKPLDFSITSGTSTIFAVRNTWAEAKSARISDELQAGKLLLRPLESPEDGADLFLLL